MKKIFLTSMLMLIAVIGSAQNFKITNNTAAGLMLHDVVLVDASCNNYTISVNVGLPPSGGNYTVTHPGGIYVTYDWGSLSLTDGVYGCVAKPVEPSYVGCLGASVLGCGIVSVNWSICGGLICVDLN